MFYPLTALLVQSSTSPELQGEALEVCGFCFFGECMVVCTHPHAHAFCHLLPTLYAAHMGL